MASQGTIKVNVTLTYVKTIINTKDIEMTKEEYDNFLKTGEVSQSIKEEVSQEEDFAIHVEYNGAELEKINK